MLLHHQFLWGLAGAAAPVLIHLLARRRARRVLFPSLRLLLAAEKKRRTLARLQQPLALLLRVLAICLVALALTGPVIRRAPGWLPLPRTRAVAILLDDTLSMTTPTAAGVLFERARAGAETALGALGSNDRVALGRLSSPAEAQWLTPTEAQAELAAMQPTASAARVAPALQRAAELLREVDAPNRAVMMLTDLQAAAWQDPAPSSSGLEDAALLLCDVGERTAANLAITAVEPLAWGEIVGRPVRLRATAASSRGEGHSGQPRKVVLQLLTEEGARAASAQEVRDRTPAVAQLGLVPAKAADVVAAIGLSGGPFGPGLDDVRYCTLRVRPPLNVLVASTGDAGRYLATALNPFGDADAAGARVRRVAPSELAETIASSRADLVILANCPALSEGAAQSLQQHAEAGGGVLLYLGDRADARHLAEQLVPRLTGDRSLHFGGMETAPQGEAFGLADIDLARQPLSALASPRAGDLGALRFSRARRLRVGAAVRVLASFDTGRPALLEWRAGKGRLILLNTSADASWGTHIRSPAYVPLLHRLAAYLARPARPSIDDVTVGERPVIAADDLPSQVTLTPPGGPPEEVAVQDGVLPEVKLPGAHRVSWSGHDVAFAANLDPRESDLTRTTEAAVRRVLAPARVSTVGPGEIGQAFAQQLPSRTDLSMPLLLLGLGLLLFESVFSIVGAGPQPPSLGP